MKTNLLRNMLAKIAALFIAIIALPTTAQAQDYVDLGLPSGTKWATCNLGASKPSDYGDYYAWGETEPKAEYTWATYKWMQTGQSDWNHITKYTFADCQTEGIWYDSDGTFIGDGKTTLEAADDAATAKLGSPWRMPTLDEIQELLDNCTWTWTTQDGKNGYEVKGKNGNTIFLPAAGDRRSSELSGAGSRGGYWSSSLGTAYSDGAPQLRFRQTRLGLPQPLLRVHGSARLCGHPCRHLADRNLCHSHRQRHLLPRRQPTATDAARREHRQDERRDNTQGHT